MCLNAVKQGQPLVQEEVAPNEAYEHSEMLLYRAMALDEGGKHSEALTHLDLCEVRRRMLWSSQELSGPSHFHPPLLPV